MRPYLIGALWFMVSAPIALLVASVIRAVTRRDIAEEAEAYLRAVSGDAPKRRGALRLAVVAAVIVGVVAMSYGSVTEVPRRIVVASSRDRTLFGTPPNENTDLRPPGASRAASPSSNESAGARGAPDAEVRSANVGPPAGEPVVAGGVLGGRSSVADRRAGDDDARRVDDEHRTADERDANERDEHTDDRDDAAGANGDDGDTDTEASTADDAAEDDAAADDDNNDAEDEVADDAADDEADDEADADDGDVDDDGIPDDEDGDIDGDDIPNAWDETPYGEDADESSDDQ